MALQVVVLFLTLFVAQSLGTPPSCAPEYPINVNVLLNSWTLRNDYGWYSHNLDMRYNGTWTSDGECEDSTFSVCTPDGGQKWLESRYIDRTLSRRDAYPVRIFVNITYSLGSCPRDDGRCDEYFELLIARNFGSITAFYRKEGIMPNNRISTSSDGDSGTKQLYFEANTTTTGFFVALRVNPGGKCVTVSRILVYNYECPGHDKQDSGLLRRPATQAPFSGSVNVISYCTDYSHSTEHSNHNTLKCTSEGRWLNEQGHCVCDSGYKKDGDRCLEAGVVILPKLQYTSMISTREHYPAVITRQTLQISSSFLLTTKRPSATRIGGGGGSIQPAILIGGVATPILILLVLILVTLVTLIVLVSKNKSKKDRGTEVSTTDNVAYAVAVKPKVVGTPNPVYEDIISGAETEGGEPDTIKNVAYETTSFPTVPSSEVPAYESIH